MKKIVLQFALGFIIILTVFIVILFNSNYKERVISLIPEYAKDFIKRNVLVYSHIKKLENNFTEINYKINNYKKKLNDKNIQTYEFTKSLNFANKYEVSFFYNNDFIWIEEKALNKPRAYFANDGKRLIKVTGNGNIFYLEKDNLSLEKKYISFKKISNNFKDIFLSEISYRNKHASIVKNILISDNNLYISFLEKRSDDCYVNSIVYANVNYLKLKFKKFFDTNFCLPYFDDSSGGNIDSSENNIFLTVGDWGIYNYKNKEIYKELKFGNPQKIDNPLGKILSIDKESGLHKIVSIGHRNQQGLYYDKITEYLYSTEHGPKGGDEVNLNKNVNDLNNYGWPISSYGEHYDFENLETSSKTRERYIVAPLKKSHEENNFIEPLLYFTPSIGISQILKIYDDKSNLEKFSLFVAALGYDKEEGDLSLHEFVMNKNHETLKHNVFFLDERIRDMEYLEEENLVILFLEKKGSIAILKKI